jgi:TMEM175 potassium channel family protein
MWLALLQLLCVAFIPFPTSVIGSHISDPVAQQFYFATLLVSGLVMVALWWYMTSRRRLLEQDLSPRFVRRTHVISAILPMTVLVLMVLVAVGIGRLINPLLLFALATLCFIVLGVLEWRVEGDEPEDNEGQGPAVADENPPESR